MQLFDGVADTACRCIIFAFSSHVQQMPGAGCALHQQRSCILVASIDSRCAIAIPPLKHSGADALIKVSRDLDHCRQICPVPLKNDWQKVTCMSCEGGTGHLRAPTLEMDIKQVEVGHLADFRVTHAIRRCGADVQCPLMAVASTGQCNSLPGAAQSQACLAMLADGVLNFSGITFFRCSSKLPQAAGVQVRLRRTSAATKGHTWLPVKGLAPRLSPRSLAGSLRLPSAVQKHG